MYKSLLVLSFYFLCCSIKIAAQNNDISFLLQKVKSEYPGYKDKARGDTYDKYVKQIIRQYPRDTFRILSLIVNYFNDQHLVVYEKNALKYLNSDSISCQRNLDMLKEYFSDSSIQKGNYEGYWINDRSDYLIAIKQDVNNHNKMKAYAIETRNNLIPQGIVCQEYELNRGNRYYTNYLTSKSGNRLYIESEFRNDSVFTTGAYGKWRKLHNYSLNLSSLPTYNNKVSGQLLDSNNFLITIPGNSVSNGELLNELLKSNSALIESTPNLIIDIRNNMGGTIATYDSLFPFVYTNPIYQVSGYRYYSKSFIDNLISKLDDYKKNKPQDSLAIKELEVEIQKGRANKGKSLLNEGRIIKYDRITAMPQNVALIINYGCQSAAEMMILDFKQSKKVTTFGEHTMGAIDYLTFFPIDLPSKKYQLMMPASKRVISRGQSKIDGKGIYPDVPITDGVTDWVQFVRDYYNKKK